ncbi:MAG: hypothetical protein IFJ97_03900 [Acidobacteria bacterium]|uniref:Uncharacterized protein n=1 Tax=Candidatus Sulfomarinibacter kjeldsenii TaxID=2885994 RepID=A0A8J7CNC7_9BACT|nr:hypothetical protein [Candidatus Sulfomarinibacter kjeldsenii]
MSDERRDDDRSPNFRSVELVTTNGAGNEKAYPVTLRTFVLRDEEEDEDCRVRIVWTKRVADYVQMLGLEVSET